MEWLATNWTWLLFLIGIPAIYLFMSRQHGHGMGCGGHQHGGTNQPAGNNPRDVPAEPGSMAESGPARSSSVPQIGAGTRRMSADQAAAGAPAGHAGHGAGPNPDQRRRRRHGC